MLLLQAFAVQKVLLVDISTTHYEGTAFVDIAKLENVWLDKSGVRKISVDMGYYRGACIPARAFTCLDRATYLRSKTPKALRQIRRRGRVRAAEFNSRDFVRFMTEVKTADITLLALTNFGEACLDFFEKLAEYLVASQK
jgi:hypothetical protein